MRVRIFLSEDQAPCDPQERRLDPKKSGATDGDDAMIPRGPDQVEEHLASHPSGAVVMTISLLTLEKQRWEGYVVEERHRLEKPQTHGDLSCV